MGGNISALATQAMTELDVTGVGGVPETGATAVVMNVTVDCPDCVRIHHGVAVRRGPAHRVQPELRRRPDRAEPGHRQGRRQRTVNLFNSEGTRTSSPTWSATTPRRDREWLACSRRVTPGRVLDTRDGTGKAARSARSAQGESINVTVTGLEDVPATGVSGVALNVTVDQPTSAGYLTVWPTGEPQPLASTHNFVPGLTVANLVLAKVGAGGQVSIFNSAGSTHVVADVVGYFSAAGGVFVPMSPQRIVDSRDGRRTWRGGPTADRRHCCCGCRRCAGRTRRRRSSTSPRSTRAALRTSPCGRRAAEADGVDRQPDGRACRCRTWRT